MIVDDIEKAVRSILEPPLSTLHSYSIKPGVGGSTELNVTCQVDESEQSRAKVLTILVSDEYRQIQIPTMLMPTLLRGRRTILRVLQEIFNIGRQHGYDLLIIDMGENFHRKMLSLGAHEVDSDTVLITPTTRLT